LTCVKKDESDQDFNQFILVWSTCQIEDFNQSILVRSVRQFDRPN